MIELKYLFLFLNIIFCCGLSFRFVKTEGNHQRLLIQSWVHSIVMIHILVMVISDVNNDDDYDMMLAIMVMLAMILSMILAMVDHT